MELLLLVFFCLLTGSEVTFGAENEPEVIPAKEGSDVILPCSLSSRQSISREKFVWRKDGRQVFQFNAGDHSNHINTGQDQQFKGRVSHFANKLRSGDASITIRDTKVADTGNYTCEFPNLQPSQTFYVNLLVFAEARLSVTIINQTKDGIQLFCEVRGAFPKPELHWQDGKGHKLPVEVILESDRGGIYEITLQTIVTKADYYRCVATQNEIHYQAYAETYVHFPGLTAGQIAGIVIAVIVVVGVVLIVYKQWVFMKGQLLADIHTNSVLPSPAARNKRLNPRDDETTGLLTEKTGLVSVDKVQVHQINQSVNQSVRTALWMCAGVVLLLPDKTEIFRVRSVSSRKVLISNVKVTLNLQPSSITMELLLLVFFCLLTGSEVTFGAENVIIVDEGRYAILPFSLNEKDDITNKKFEWKKDGRQVFLYDDGDHSNIVNTGQDQQFKGRVSHFSNKLKSGNASIIIRNTMVADSGDYTCELTNLNLSQTFHFQLRVLEKKVIKVDEGRDVTLPCSLSSRQDITPEMFKWKKDGRQVFLYDAGDHSDNFNTGQGQQFRGRVEHFPDKLKSGDASITIRNTNVADTGEYTCEFPYLQPEQMFHMKFVFDTSPQPCVRRLKQTKDGIQLQCEVRGASPKPELHWEDGAGNVLLAEKPQEIERGGIYNVILQTIVTKTDIYCCVATQEAINQTTHDDINVYIPGLTAGQIALIVIIVVGVVGLVFAVYIRRYRIISFFMRVEAKPSVRIVEQRDKSALLQCEVRGAFPKPKLHWEDREGHKLPAEEPQESERGGHYDIILITTVTKTDIYRCVATQKEINHQAHADIHVHISALQTVFTEAVAT
ncbi:CD276 antigen-like isoform X5 [Scomber scombrus]|uniref:CD276 antigen-like isoform X5 n=1 Tax=Scomber scombrus TaxID=13677 RepID=A0AAV1QIW1_SCOSC